MPASLPEPLRGYRCWAFDCDGVLLDSNRVKTDAFYQAALPYGEEVAQRLVDYHLSQGGVSRYKKFEYFFREIIGTEATPSDLEVILDAFARRVREGLASCVTSPGLEEALSLIPRDVTKIVVSGSDQTELQAVFRERGLDRFFDGIYGSPDTKESIISRERERGVLADPGIFIGDSRYDFEVARGAGLDFIFVHAYSEFDDWQRYFADKRVTIARDVATVCEISQAY